MKTFTIKGEYNDRKWFIIDAQDKILGRMCSQIASILRGKHKPVFSPHRDVGDFVVVVNADKVKLSGLKGEQKVYYKHTGYVGHLSTISFKHMRETNPEFIVHDAVRKMLPHNTLGRKMLKKLKIYVGEKHPHTAQKPEPLVFKN